MNIDDIYKQSNLLANWHDLANKFLGLAMLARRSFSILVTSVGVERQFSSSGLTITERHSRLDADTVNDFFPSDLYKMFLISNQIFFLNINFVGTLILCINIDY